MPQFAILSSSVFVISRVVFPKSLKQHSECPECIAIFLLPNITLFLKLLFQAPRLFYDSFKAIFLSTIIGQEMGTWFKVAQWDQREEIIFLSWRRGVSVLQWMWTKKHFVELLLLVILWLWPELDSGRINMLRMAECREARIWVHNSIIAPQHHELQLHTHFTVKIMY